MFTLFFSKNQLMHIKCHYLFDTTPTYVSILIGSSSGGLYIKLHFYTSISSCVIVCSQITFLLLLLKSYLTANDNT